MWWELMTNPLFWINIAAAYIVGAMAGWDLRGMKDDEE